MATTLDIECTPLNPQVSANPGNSYYGLIALTAYDWGGIVFTKDVNGKYEYRVAVPKNVNATPNAKLVLVLLWNNTAASKVSRMSVACKAVAADAASLNPASLTAETAIDVACPTTAYQTKEVIFPASGNLSETLAAGNRLLVEVYHEGAHANDTVAFDTLLEAVYLRCDVG